MPGPRLDSTPRYYKHPPAASGHLFDGAPLDAGTAHILHNNASHLAVENVRLIGHAMGPGTALPVDPWLGITDAAPPADGSVLAMISWRQADGGMVFGPYPASFAALETDPPGYRPRSIRVLVELTQTSQFDSDFTVAAALTTGPGTPLHATVLAEDHDRFIVTGSGTPGPSTSRLVRLDLDVPAPQRTTESWRSADDVSNTILPLWVWVGYYTTAALLAVDSVEAVSVYEVKVT